MNKTNPNTLPKVVRTWMLLLSIPLYVGTATLWLKDEIKKVVSEKEENVIALVKEQAKKALAYKESDKGTLVLP